MKFISLILCLFSAGTVFADTFKKIDAGTLNPKFQGSTLYIPDHLTAEAGGVMMLHGSTMHEVRFMDNNGLPEYLAENGFLVFDLCYFECPGNAGFDAWALYEYDLYKTYEALEWFQGLKTFSGRVGLFGLSRGAEQASLLNEMIQKDRLPIQPIATVLHSSTDRVVGPFAWRWVLDLTLFKRPGCWACADGTSSCMNSSTLSAEDQLWVRHMGYNGSKSQFVWRPDVCGPDPRQLDLSHASAYLWKSQKIQNYYIWPETFGGRDYNPAGHAIEFSSYPGAYLILHGSKDEVWPVAFSNKNAEGLFKNQLANPAARPIISRDIFEDESTVEISKLTSAKPTSGPFVDSRHWHQFYVLNGANHTFVNKKAYTKIRKQLVKEFFDTHLSQ